MQRVRLRILIVTTVITTAISSARTADLVEPIPSGLSLPDISSTFTEKPLEVISGWYLRGDIGGSFADTKRLASYPGGASSLHELDYKDTPSFSMGAGYQFTDILRFDATIGVNKRSVTAGLSRCGNGGASCGDELHAKATSWDLMTNAYLDIPTEWGFTPYVGAGAGVAHVSYKSTKVDQTCGQAKSCEVAYGLTDNWRPSWALMTGVAIPLTEYAQLDLGYRYSEVGKGPAFPSVNGNKQDRGIANHEMRAGVRIQAW